MTVTSSTSSKEILICVYNKNQDKYSPYLKNSPKRTPATTKGQAYINIIVYATLYGGVAR